MVKKDLFSRLQRLFSTDVIIRNIGGNEIKVMDVNQIQKDGNIRTNSLYDRYNRIYSTGQGSSLYGSQLNQNYQILRPQLYSDYDAMDTEAIIASVLDIIADECTLKNNMGEILQIKSSDEGIQKILYNLFYDVLNIEFNLWSWIRQMCKYGDFFLKLEIAEKFGIYNIIPHSAYHIERQEQYNNNQIKVQFRYNPEGLAGGSFPIMPNDTAGGVIFENYEVAHFRLTSDMNFLPYGRSYIEPGRKVWKQYSLAKDAMLLHRIMRSPEKRVYYINVGNIPPQEIEAFMQKTISKIKKVPFIDPNTGEYNLKFNMQNLTEDFYMPVRAGDNTTKIDTIKGLDYDGIQDVSYLRDELFAALKVPKAFIGYEKDLSGKATLAAQDIRFAHTIERIQRIILAELYRIALVHLYSQGIEGDNLTNFELSLTTPSIIYDQEKTALLKEQVDLAKNMMEINLFPTDYIYDKLFHHSEDEIAEFRDLLVEDKKRFFRLQQLGEEGNDPLETGKSYGTPHDLATLYGSGRYDKMGPVPPGYENDKSPLGRPVEKVSNLNTQNDPLGKDRLGSQAMKKDDQTGKKPNFSIKEAKQHYLQNKKLFESLKAKKTTEEDKE